MLATGEGKYLQQTDSKSKGLESPERGANTEGPGWEMRGVTSQTASIAKTGGGELTKESSPLGGHQSLRFSQLSRENELHSDSL